MSDQNKCKRKQNDQQLDAKRPRMDTDSESEECTNMEDKPTMDQAGTVIIEENSEISEEEGSDEDEKSVSMIRPTLLRQLQTILSEYPDDAQILREMVQNAEDAGATCMKIMYDNRPIDPGGTSEIRQYFRTPAICVYNDAMFTDKDWEGIITIYNSCKEKEPLKVGRFGLGFKSVFHMTDCPVIISGKKLLVIDPLKSEKNEQECKDVPLKIFRKKHCPEVTLANILNRFDFNIDVLMNGFYKGTLFWFPLRQNESALSTTIYSEEKTDRLFSSFITEASYNLLFLKTLEKIEIQNHQNEPYFVLELKGIDDTFNNVRKNFREQLNRLNNELPHSSIVSKFEAIVTTPSTEDQFVIVSCLTGSAKLSDKMKSLSTDKELHYSPYTGVAYCTRTNRPKKPAGHIFCFLPLPITDKSLTGLPVHVNGFFDLEHNRRHLKESAANNDSRQTDKSLLWNNGMISELLPDSYYEVVQLLKERSETGGNSPELIHNYYSSIPAPDDVETSWKPLYEALCEKLVAEANFYTTQGGGKWIYCSEAVFTINDQHSDHTDIKLPKSVKDLLLDCKENLVEVPLHIMQTLKASGYTPEPVSSKMVCEKLKNNEYWKSYQRDKKLELLTFIIQEENFTDLENIQLLPLNNNTFTTFSFSETKRVYVVSDETAKLFPKLDEHLVSSTSVKDIIWKQLDQMANKGLFQLTDLKKEYLPIVLQATFDANCDRKNTHHFVQRSDLTLDLQWIRDVWKEISTRGYENLSFFETVPLIPIVHDEHATTTHDHSRNKIEFLQLKGKYLMSSLDDHPPLPISVSKAVELLGVRIISPTQTLIFPHVEVKEKYIRLPLPENVFKYFQEASALDIGNKLAMKINESLSDQERLELLTYLSNHCADIPKDAYPFLQLLKLFKQFDNLNDPEMVSIKENQTKLTNFVFPKGLPYPRKLLMNEFSEVVNCLGGNDIKEEDCIAETLDLMLTNNPMYSTDDMKKLMIYINNRPKDVFYHVVEKVEKLVFIPSSDGKMYKVTDLFNFTSRFLRDLFEGENGVFPTEEFIEESENYMPFLKDLKMKKEEHVSAENLIMVATSLNNLKSEDTPQRKAESLISFLNKNPSLILDQVLNIQDLKWIPVSILKPEGYPKNLPWCNSFDLCSPNEVKTLDFKYLVGSVIPLVDVKNFNDRIACYYGWNKPPAQHDVIMHLENVVKSYHMNQNTEYMLITRAIFKYIDGIRIDGLLESDSIAKLSSLHCIPTNSHGLMPVNKVVIEVFNCHINFRLEPFIYELASDVKDYSETFKTLGVKPSVDFQTLKSILEQLKQKHDVKDRTQVSRDQVAHDITFIVNILKAVTDMDIDRSDMKELFVPVSSSGLKFETVENCTYTSSRSSLSRNIDRMDEEEDDDQEIIYVHQDINFLAPKLGVPSVTKRFIIDQNSTPLPWGQKEKLTTRLSNLLEGYADGFAVPKELIQNADDAGASRVCFLFDERENADNRDGLFDKGMGECQGKALWVYNDAVFQQEDFKNITDLGGKTKILKTDKIGKFGLGFSSVYNLTDVPSFVSKNTLVVLDPHLNHLGDAAIDQNPGLLIPLTKKYRRNFPNQFMPYNGIFGCNLSPSNDDEFSATLFRLPLRTERQSETSEIKKLHYTKREVVELLLKFVDAAANLLLFTQNVKEISVYHLDKKSTNPESDMQLLFQTRKCYINEDSGHSAEEVFNVLKKIAVAVEEKINNEKKFPIQIIDIEIEVYKEAQVLAKEFKPIKEICSWVISWSTGSQSFDIARNLKNQGAIPVGSVAVPVKRNGNILTSFMQMNQLPMGFYKQSRIFCFLPLPIETELPLHINGCFMVEQDRKSLVRLNLEDKTNERSRWNDSMFGDIILSAYFNLLSSIAQRSKDSILNFDYWTLWPQMKQTLNLDFDILFTSFYTRILYENLHVFYRKEINERPAITNTLSKSVFLDPIFRNAGDIGDIAYECLLEFHKEETTVMDMPEHIYNNLIKANQDNVSHLERRILSKYDFYEKYVFPYLTSVYWVGDMSSKRDRLLIEALEDNSLHTLVKVAECIPVKSTGNVLRRPNDLILESGLVGKMYEDTDCRFPSPVFSKYESILIDMGMMVDEISSTMLIERLQLVKGQIQEKSLSRSRSVINYLNKAWEKHRNDQEVLHTTQFLPVMKKPKDWPLPWKENEQHRNNNFLSPSEIFSASDMNAVGSVGYIIDSVEISRDVLQFIGVKKVTFDDALMQLEIVGAENMQYSEHLENICTCLLNTLNNYIQKNKGVINDDVLKRLLALNHQKIICVKPYLVEPDCVATHLIGSCSPYLFKMTASLQKYNDLWEVMQIPNYFCSATLIQVLADRKKEVGEKVLSAGDMESIVNILDNLCSALKYERKVLSTLEKNTIFVPDERCHMRPISDVCFDDRYPGILQGSKDLYVIHKHVRQDVVESLGIMSKRHFHLTRSSYGIPFGQKEKLVTRLKNIISAYPSDHSVLNELLQNADDAGATQIHFILDKRNHNTERVFDDKWAMLQGPALCVFNDTCFSNDDLIGIQNLGEGSKSEDPTKTGQFGVGFNAVYHLTDVPSFLTRGSTTPNGGTYCVFDPHCMYVPTAEPDTPGMQIQDLEILKNDYHDIYYTYLQKELPAETGTWFRFPLRTEIMAEKSSICKNSVTLESVNNMLQKMKHNMKKSLLFLNNVKKISVSSIEEDGSTLYETFTVQLVIPDIDEKRRLDFISSVQEVSKMLKQKTMQLKDIPFQEVGYRAVIRIGFSEEDWFVVQDFGFPEPSNIPDQIILEFKKGNIGLLPRAGTALLKSEKIVKGKAFCFLPLPIETGLPVHINGHFALDQNRSHLFGGTHKEDHRYVWNKCLLEQVVAHSYASCIHYYMYNIHKNNLSVFFKQFPIFELVKEDWWKLLTFQTYKSILDRQLTVFPICPSFTMCLCSEHSKMVELARRQEKKDGILKWVAIQTKEEHFTAKFDDLGKFFEVKVDQVDPPIHKTTTDLGRKIGEVCECHREHDVRLTLIDLGMKLICTPLCIHESINQSCKFIMHGKERKYEGEENFQCICTTNVDPESTVQFLKSWNSNFKDKCLINTVDISLSETILGNLDRLALMLHFCLKSVNKSIKELNGVPLLVDNNELLLVLYEKNSLVLSEYCDIFLKSGEKFVNTKLVSYLKLFQNSFNALTLDNFKELLPVTINPSVFKTDQYMEWSEETNFPDAQWMRKFWNCLETFGDVKGHLLDWCLFPCDWRKKKYLVSFKMAYTVLNLNSFDDEHWSMNAQITLKNVLGKMNLPLPSIFTKHSIHLRNLVATKQMPSRLVSCLDFHKEEVNWDALCISAREKLLTFFNESVQCFQYAEKEKLASLCLFTTITDKVVKLEAARRILVVKQEQMHVIDGLDDLSFRTNTILIRHNAYHEKLYTYLGCTLCYPTSQEVFKNPLLTLYTSFILPNFSYLDKTVHLHHLTFVRDQLMDYEEIKTMLRDLCFIPSNRSDDLLTASSFFSPHNPVCQKLCDADDLPPNPFCEVEWKNFMDCAGMKSIITKELFLTFARKIQQTGLNDESEAQSKELICHLFKQPNLGEEIDFLKEVSRINFIPPYIVPEKYSKICEQSCADRLVPFKEAICTKHFKLAWTMKTILPPYAVPSDDGILAKLSIKSKPSIDTVVSHVHKVCDALRQIQLNREDIMQLMSSFYKYLADKKYVSEAELEQLKIRFAETPIIHVMEHNTLVQAKLVVLDIPKALEIIPYLMKASTGYGPFFDLFKILGAAEDISIKHYCQVLQMLKKETEDFKITHLEIPITEKAILGVLNCLNKPDNLVSLENEVSVLYLLNEGKILKPSSELVMDDIFNRRRRLKEQTVVDFMHDLSMLKKHNQDLDPTLLLKKLPERLRPKLLSFVIGEEVLPPIDIVPSEFAAHLECFISGEIFRYILKRLAKTRQKRDHISLDDNNFQKIILKLRSFRVLALSRLETWLLYNGQHINGSNELKFVFFDTEDNILYVQEGSLLTNEWISKHSFYIARVVSNICLKMVKTSDIQACLPYFRSPKLDVEKFLDEYGAVGIDFEIEHVSWYPIPGTAVEQEFIDYLITDFTDFEVGDIVVFEKFDNEGDSYGEDNFVYIYAKVILKVVNETVSHEQLPLFRINIGDEEINVRLHRLYKIVRPSRRSTSEVELYTDGNENMKSAKREELFQIIEETLVDGWKLGEVEFKRVLRRLVRRWHPDKNQNSSFSTEVFQHLMDFVQKLLSGLFDVSKVDQYRNHSARDWQEYKQRATCSNARCNESYTFDANGFASDIIEGYRRRSRHRREWVEHKYYPDPQPHMARIWIKQAKYDIEAARSAIEFMKDVTCNWVCVQSQQAAEKALKAVQIQIDAKQVSKSHSLLSSSVVQTNVPLKELAEKLENKIGIYSRMRYPRLNEYPKTPSELYTREDAIEVVELATKIVDLIDDIYFQ